MRKLAVVVLVAVVVVLLAVVSTVAAAAGGETAKAAGKAVTAGVAYVEKDKAMAATYTAAQAELPMTGSNCSLVLDGYWTGGKDSHPSAGCSDGPTTLAYCSGLNLGKLTQRMLVGANGRLTKVPQTLIDQCAATGKAAQSVKPADFVNK